VKKNTLTKITIMANFKRKKFNHLLAYPTTWILQVPIQKIVEIKYTNDEK